MIKLFIVEDERNIREGLSMFLSNIPDIEVDGVFSDAESALAKIRDYPPSIVVTDIVMKNMTGIEMIKECRKFNQECEFIIISGYNELEYARAAIKYNVSEFLEKPIDHEELLNAVEKIKKRIYYIREARRSLIINMIENNIEAGAVKEYFPGVSVRMLKINVGAAENNTPEENKKLKWQALKDEEMLCRYMIVSSVQYGVITAVLIDDRITPQKIEKFLSMLQVRINSGVIRCGLSSCGEVSDLHRLNKDTDLALTHACIHSEQYVFAEQLPYLKNPKAAYAGNIADIIPYLKSLDYESIREQVDGAIEKLAAEAHPYALYEFALKCMQFMQSILPNLELDKQKGFIMSATSKDELKERIGMLMREACRSAKETGSDSYDPDLEQVIKYIDLNYMRNDISAKQMAQKMYLNPEYFSRKFKNATGTNYSEYITNLRINKAKELLRLRNYSISQVAEMVGYQTVRYFSKVFKKHVGIMPKDYRNGDKTN